MPVDDVATVLVGQLTEMLDGTMAPDTSVMELPQLVRRMDEGLSEAIHFAMVRQGALEVIVKMLQGHTRFSVVFVQEAIVLLHNLVCITTDAALDRLIACRAVDAIVIAANSFPNVHTLGAHALDTVKLLAELSDDLAFQVLRGNGLSFVLESLASAQEPGRRAGNDRVVVFACIRTIYVLAGEHTGCTERNRPARLDILVENETCESIVRTLRLSPTDYQLQNLGCHILEVLSRQGGIRDSELAAKIWDSRCSASVSALCEVFMCLPSDAVRYVTGVMTTGMLALGSTMPPVQPAADDDNPHAGDELSAAEDRRAVHHILSVDGVVEVAVAAVRRHGNEAGGVVARRVDKLLSRLLVLGFRQEHASFKYVNQEIIHRLIEARVFEAAKASTAGLPITAAILASCPGLHAVVEVRHHVASITHAHVTHFFRC